MCKQLHTHHENEAKRLGEEINTLMARINEAWGEDKELLRRVQSDSSQMAMVHTRNNKLATHNHNNTTKTKEGGEDVNTPALCIYFCTIFFVYSFTVLVLYYFTTLLLLPLGPAL